MTDLNADAELDWIPDNWKVNYLVRAGADAYGDVHPLKKTLQVHKNRQVFVLTDRTARGFDMCFAVPALVLCSVRPHTKTDVI